MDQTNRSLKGPDSCRIDTTEPTRPDDFSMSKLVSYILRGIFFWNPPQKGLEGKNQTFRVSRGLQEEERKEEIYLYRKRTSNIYIYKGRGIKLAFFFCNLCFFWFGVGFLAFFIVCPAIFINFPIVFASFPAFFLHFP